MTNTIKWGVISTANIGYKEVLPAIVKAENAELMAIGSANASKRQEMAEALNITKQYDSYEGVLDDSEVQAVYIPLPNHLHKEWVIKAAQAGKHVLVEKPIGLTVQEAEEMAQVCQENGVLLMEAFMYQFHPEHDFVKQLIKNKEIGEVRLMRASFTFNMGPSPQANIRLNRNMGGGSIYDVGCYCLHSIRHILETMPTEVYTQATLHPEHGVDMAAQGVLKLENGATAQFDCGFNATDRETYEVIGTEGTILVKNAYRPDKNPGSEGEVIISRAGKPDEHKFFAGNPYVTQIEHFSDCVANGNALRYPPAQSVQTLRILEAAYESIATGQKVVL